MFIVKLFLDSFEISKMELLQSEYVQGNTMLYLYQDKAC